MADVVPAAPKTDHSSEELPQSRIALFFGCWSPDWMGHFLYGPTGRKSYHAKRDYPGIPWDEALMDGDLLKNGKRPDVVDGKVFWTCGGRDVECLWHAFYWWDRSGDHRGASNSGFYTYGFRAWGFADAFAFACEQFPAIVRRQRAPLSVQPGSMKPDPKLVASQSLRP